MFGDVTYRDKNSISEQWRMYFKSLYSFSNAGIMDKRWQETVKTEVKDIDLSLEQRQTREIRVSIDTFYDQLKVCKRGKMCGFDNIYYEHMIYGGDNLQWA